MLEALLGKKELCMTVHLTAATTPPSTAGDQTTADCLEYRNHREATVSDSEILPFLELLSESRLWIAFVLILSVLLLNGMVSILLLCLTVELLEHGLV